jgi:hypothetical protein
VQAPRLHRQQPATASALRVLFFLDPVDVHRAFSIAPP